MPVIPSVSEGSGGRARTAAGLPGASLTLGVTVKTMPTYKLTIEYEGTRYSGWQAQGNTQKTIQGHLIRAATQVFGDVDLGGAGRTDAGVHASAQVAHLRIRKAADPLQLTRKINDLLPHDI